MQNSNQQNDQYDQDQIANQEQTIQEYEDGLTEEERAAIERERKEQAKRRIKARQQFRSPWFFLGVIFLLFIVIYPRCSYKDNLQKEYDRKAQNQAELQKKQQPQQREISEEQQGMVPKF